MEPVNTLLLYSRKPVKYKAKPALPPIDATSALFRLYHTATHRFATLQDQIGPRRVRDIVMTQHPNLDITSSLSSYYPHARLKSITYS